MLSVTVAPLRDVLRKLFRVWTGVHTQYAGTGRVRFVSFGAGAGYQVPVLIGRGWDGKPLDTPGWRPNLRISGWTLYIRTAPTSHPSIQQWPRPRLGRVKLTRNPNLDLWAAPAISDEAGL